MMKCEPGKCFFILVNALALTWVYDVQIWLQECDNSEIAEEVNDEGLSDYKAVNDDD